MLSQVEHLAIAELKRPECLTHVWWEAAVFFPVQAMHGPLYPLLTLESPERWLALEEENVDMWIDGNWEVLRDEEVYLFIADCAEHVLYLVEQVHPGDLSARNAIEVSRQWARGEATLEEREEAETKARKVVAKGPVDGGALAPCWWKIEGRPELRGLWHAAMAYAFSVANRRERAAEWEAARRRERCWQWHCLLGYLARRTAP